MPDIVRLPVLPKPAQPMPFPVGSLVRLIACPIGQPVRVEGMRHGRVVVFFPDIAYTGKYKPEKRR
jgi:hypothetical protein